MKTQMDATHTGDNYLRLEEVLANARATKTVFKAVTYEDLFGGYTSEVYFINNNSGFIRYYTNEDTSEAAKEKLAERLKNNGLLSYVIFM